MTRTSFEFTAGCLSLNLVDTIANQATTPNDLLKNPSDLGRWLTQAIPHLGDEPDVSRSELKKIRKLREAIFQSVNAIVSGQEPDPMDMDFINQLAAEPDLRPQWSSGHIELTSGDTVRASFAAIAADAVLCLSEPSSDRIRRCVECQMFFLDNTRAQNRRWCSSSSGCGNRAKVRRHRAAKAKAGRHDG
ncbi:MAG: ABATE domain-containing protein [Sneathiellales bacterium]|nr:ABATE domain-containing protein [Sneathiellales bacterium]